MKLTASIAATLALAGTALAGPLAPPPGAPASTGKTTQEIFDRVAAADDALWNRIARTPQGMAEPRIPVQSLAGSTTSMHLISQPGSYYLTGNISVDPGKYGIIIASSDVVIDLNGYTIDGNNLASTRGIGATFDRFNLAVRNGSVVNMAGEGVHLGNAPSSLVENIMVRKTGGVGVVLGQHNVGRNIVVHEAGATGISLGDRTTLTDSIANKSVGSGIGTSGDALIERCTAYFNGNHGFILGSSTTVMGSRAAFNTVTGFTTTSPNVSISGSMAYQNGDDGFRLANENHRIDNCVARGNAADGFQVGGTTFITNSTASANGVGASVTDGAGFRLAGNANRVDNCMANGNDVGLIIPSGVGGNMVVRTSFTFNPTRYTASPGNNVAAMIVTPGDVFNATNPWANLAH